MDRRCRRQQLVEGRVGRGRQTSPHRSRDDTPDRNRRQGVRRDPELSGGGVEFARHGHGARRGARTCSSVVACKRSAPGRSPNPDHEIGSTRSSGAGTRGHEPRNRSTSTDGSPWCAGRRASASAGTPTAATWRTSRVRTCQRLQDHDGWARRIMTSDAVHVVRTRPGRPGRRPSASEEDGRGCICGPDRRRGPSLDRHCFSTAARPDSLASAACYRLVDHRLTFHRGRHVGSRDRDLCVGRRPTGPRARPKNPLQTRLRPLVVRSRLGDPPEKVGFPDQKWVRVPGGGAVAEVGSTIDLSCDLVAQRRERHRGLDRWASSRAARRRRAPGPERRFAGSPATSTSRVDSHRASGKERFADASDPLFAPVRTRSRSGSSRSTSVQRLRRRTADGEPVLGDRPVTMVGWICAVSSPALEPRPARAALIGFTVRQGQAPHACATISYIATRSRPRCDRSRRPPCSIARDRSRVTRGRAAPPTTAMSTASSTVACP